MMLKHTASLVKGILVAAEARVLVDGFARLIIRQVGWVHDVVGA